MSRLLTTLRSRAAGGGGPPPGPVLPDGWRVRTALREWSIASQVIDYPDGTVEGDLLLLVWVTAYDQFARDPGTPSGWTSRYAYNYLGHNRVYSRVAGVETSVTVGATTSETDIVFALMSTSEVAGYDTANPFGATGQNAGTDTAAAITTPTLLTTRKHLALFSAFNNTVGAVSSLDARLTEVMSVKHPNPSAESIRRPWLVLGLETDLPGASTAGYDITWDANTYRVGARLQFNLAP